MSARRLAAAVVTLAAAGAAALAGDDADDATARAGDAGAPTAAPGASIGAAQSHDPRTILLTAFADQRGAVERAAAQVGDKLATAGATRTARARAAYAVLRADASTGRAVVPTGADAAAHALEPALAIARRRAAVKWLLARDRDEQRLLADEAAQLATARARIDADAQRARSIALPADLVWPVAGAIARRFGPYEHTRSGATLTRRGVDLEVDADAIVVAPAAGTVRYAGPIRGLDLGVIVDHGDYLTVIGKLATPAVHAGDAIAQGAPLGHPARRRVYFEVRVEVGPGGTPIDPETVLPPR